MGRNEEKLREWRVDREKKEEKVRGEKNTDTKMGKDKEKKEEILGTGRDLEKEIEQGEDRKTEGARKEEVKK